MYFTYVSVMMSLSSADKLPCNWYASSPVLASGFQAADRIG